MNTHPNNLTVPLNIVIVIINCILVKNKYKISNQTFVINELSSALLLYKLCTVYF